MKKKNRGFMLVETLVVSTFIISTLVYLYIQFINLKKSYDISFRYDTITGLYNIKEVDKFINNNYGYAEFINNSDMISKGYIELYNGECNITYFSKYQNYCEKLISDIDAKTILLAKSDLTTLKNAFKDKNPYSNNLYLYVKNINNTTNLNTYLLIVEYNDNTFSNIKIEKEEVE